MPKEPADNVMASEAETITSFYGILAGLSFTVSVLIFSYRSSLPSSDIFLTLSLVDAVLFIYAATLASEASIVLSKGDMQSARRYLNGSEGFGFLGFVLMLSEISFIAFCTGWQHGVTVTTVIVLGFGFILIRYAYPRLRARKRIEARRSRE